jgi:hypothetical protein
MDIRDNGYEESNEMKLAQDSEQLRDFVLAVLYLKVHLYRSIRYEYYSLIWDEIGPTPLSNIRFPVDSSSSLDFICECFCSFHRLKKQAEL